MKTPLCFILLLAWVCGLATAVAQPIPAGEALDRGLVAVTRPEGGVLVSWRLGCDERQARFALLRDGTEIATVGADQACNVLDTLGTPQSLYTLHRLDVAEDAVTATPWPGRLTLRLQRPEGGHTPPFQNQSGWQRPEGEDYHYLVGDIATGDLDGDGQLDLVVMWEPSNRHDNSHSGFTGNVYLDGYRLDGRQLWRIDLGRNIRAGAHYTQLMVYDLDGDGTAEVACRTAPGTVDGRGQSVLLPGDSLSADYRDYVYDSRTVGYVMSGPEYLTVFGGRDGRNLTTVPFQPERGDMADWGDVKGNRCDRFLACVAYLDGQRPSLVMCRGYYMRSALAAYDFRDGQLTLRWQHVSAQPGEPGYSAGNHNLSVADVDGDGHDEVVYGACCFDHDGSVIYDTHLGHGDAMHVGRLDPANPDLLVWEVHEEGHAIARYGYELHNARTGEVLWGGPTPQDNGRGCAADIDARYPGYEMWSNGSPNVYDCHGQVIGRKHRMSCNFRIYWDGDLQDELLDRTTISKWDGEQTRALRSFEDCRSNNGSKATPALMADLVGDWREEVILADKDDPSVIHLFTTDIPTPHRMFSLLCDRQYRLSIVWQNVAYNQPPHLSFWLGAGTDQAPWH